MLYAIKKAIADNIEGIAYLHKDRFRDHFLGHYPIFIIERFYESFLDTSLFFVALQENNVVGFVMGGTSTELQTFKKNFTLSRKIFLNVCYLPYAYHQYILMLYTAQNK